MLLQPGEKAIGVLESMTCLPVHSKTLCESESDAGQRGQCSADNQGSNPLTCHAGQIAARSLDCFQANQLCSAFKLMQACSNRRSDR